MFSGIKSDSAENLLHKPTIIPALLLKYFTDVFVAWKSDVYCSHFTGSKTGVEGLVSHHASGASVPVGSREGLSLTVKVNRGEKNHCACCFIIMLGLPAAASVAQSGRFMLWCCRTGWLTDCIAVVKSPWCSWGDAQWCKSSCLFRLLQVDTKKKF